MTSDKGRVTSKTEEEKTDRRRNVFSYHNGTSTIFADPLVIHRRLTRALGGNPNEVCSRADLGVFAMTPFDTSTGEGATELDCRDALAAFVTFLGDQKKTAVSSPTSSPPTENPPQ